MPIYEYVCEKCGNKFELLKKNSSSDENKCPVCGSDKVIKQFSVFMQSSKKDNRRNAILAVILNVRISGIKHYIYPFHCGISCQCIKKVNF